VKPYLDFPFFQELKDKELFNTVRPALTESGDPSSSSPSLWSYSLNSAAKVPNLWVSLQVNLWHFLTMLCFIRLRSSAKSVLFALGSPSFDFHILLVFKQG
jgi:hypothetical protein